MDLSGPWRAQESAAIPRRRRPDPALDESAWPEIPVPAHWRSAPAFAASEGPVVYRRRFDFPRPAEGRRSWLVLEGVFYRSRVWLDNRLLGDTEGYFFPHTFEVTRALADRTEHLLAAEVACARPTDRRAKDAITGVFQHWDCLDPDWNPGGLWRPVRLEESGPVRIEELGVLCRHADERTAEVELRAVLDAATPADTSTTAMTGVTLHTRIGGHDHQCRRMLVPGPNDVTWTVAIDRPELWWPRALGDPVLHDVTVEVRRHTRSRPRHAGDPVSDGRRLRTGLRRLRMRRWQLGVNGERLFLKGANQGPTRMALGEASASELAGDVALACDAGLDLLRVHGHVSRPELYDAADEAGLLVWQDFPLQWGYARSIGAEAERQAAKMTAYLGHHPSIAVWCAHNEPIALDLEPGWNRPPASALVQFAAAYLLPTWNKTVLDRRIGNAVGRADPTRPVVPHSGVPPHPGSDGTDVHLYFGWYHGRQSQLGPALALWPKLGRFVSEFGAQAVPDTDDFLEPHKWPDLDWRRLSRTHCMQPAIFEHRVPPGDHDTFEAWRGATQRYQAQLIKHHVETLRLLKYRPAGGFCQFAFADAFPSVTWSVLDHARRPKQGYKALQQACRPVIVVASPLEERHRPGDPLALDVHVVSDLRHALDGARVRATLEWSGGEHAWSWEGDVPADGCVRVGTLQAVVPAAPGPLTLAIDLIHLTISASNRYEAVIGPT